MHIITQKDNLQYHLLYQRLRRAVEDYLLRQKFLPVDLPVLTPALIPEGYLEVFETSYKYMSHRQKLYLTPSPELFLKRLLCQQIGNCFYLGKAFRNAEPPSDRHLPEFTLLEFYKINSDYFDMADELLRMLRYVSQSLFKKNEIIYLGKIISLNFWEKLTVAEAFRKYADITAGELFDRQAFLMKAKSKGYTVESFSYEEIWSQIYSQEIEPHLGMNGRPTLIYDYPKEFAALAKHNTDQQTARRFEFYIAGIELGNCYEELTDWKEQKRRFNQELVVRKKSKKLPHPVDKGFIEALKYGLPDCTGIAIGMERLGMIFAGVETIDKLQMIRITE